MQSGIMEIHAMTATEYIRSIYDSIAASRRTRGKPCPSYADWLAEVNHLAAVARATAIGAR